MSSKRSSLVSKIGLLALLLAILAACGGVTPPATEAPGQATPGAATPGAADATPAPGGEVAKGSVTMPYLSGGITSFDHAYWTSQLLVAQGTIFEGLYGYDPQLNVVPKVAASASASADNKVWTIKLRQDKKWSNGEPVTAKDFYASWMRFMGPTLKDAPMWAGMWSNVENAWAFKNGAVGPEEVGLKLVDDYTLEITLTQPNAALPNLLAISTSMPINAKSLEQHPDDWWDPKHAVFNGPYLVSAWVNGADTTLTRNPNYVGEDIGNVATIVLRPYQDANARLQDFENGVIQFTQLEDASQLAYAQNVPAMADNMKEEVNGLGWRGLQFNRSLDPGPLLDGKVRQALAMAIDKQAISEQVLRGLAVPASTFGADERVTASTKSLPYDVAKAKQLLADAGYADGQGFPGITFYAPPANDPQMPMIEAIAKMWEQNLGITVEIQNLEGPVYNSMQWAGFNKDVKPGFTTLGGPMNWIQPMDLLMATSHIWYYMDYKEGGMAKYAEYQQQIDAVPDTAAAGDWAELETRATTAWAKRQEIAAKEQNEWGALMLQAPTFKEQFDKIAERFKGAADDEAKLSAYKDGLTLVLKEEQDLTWYDYRTEENKQAQREMIKLSQATMDSAWDIVAPLQQLAVDSAWMIPIYNEKLIYTTDPRLSGVVMNKLSWGGVFQYQYLRWTES